MAKRKSNERSQQTITPTIPSPSGFQRLLADISTQACSELVEGALSQLEFELADVALQQHDQRGDRHRRLLRAGRRVYSSLLSTAPLPRAGYPQAEWRSGRAFLDR